MAARDRWLKRRRRRRAERPLPAQPADDGALADPAGERPAALTERPRTFYQPPEGEVRRDLDESAVLAALESGVGNLWVDVDVRSAEQHAWLKRVFRFHPLAIEDTLNPESRVKYDEYPGYLFVIARGVRFDDATPDPYDLATSNLCFFLGPHFLVTVHRTDTTVCDEAAERLVTRPALLARGVARLMHAILDLSVDRYFPILDQLDQFVDELEERVFIREERGILQEIFVVKQLVLELRRHLLPQRDVLNSLTNRPSPYLPPDAQVYFRDVYDHVLRITDSFETYRELLASTIEGSLSQTSNRLATVTKTLSIMATLSIPFVMVSGMWGMNFADVPLANHPHGFWIMLLAQLGLGAATIVVLRILRLL